MKAMLLAVLMVVAPFEVAAAADATRGKQLYFAHGCYGCHGYNGETGARDLVATDSPLIGDLATFRMFLRQRGDQAPLLPSTRMPNYPERALDDAAVADLYAFVRTFRPDKPAIERTPTLKAILDSAAKRPAAGTR